MFDTIDTLKKHHGQNARNGKCTHLARQRRQESAKERQAHYDSLTTAQKLAALDAKLGEGIGAKKQRAKLAKQLAKAA